MTAAENGYIRYLEHGFSPFDPLELKAVFWAMNKPVPKEKGHKINDAYAYACGFY